MKVIQNSMNKKPSKTKTSFYRRIYIAYLIDSGINTVPKIITETGMHRRTAQDTILALKELGMQHEFIGGNKDGSYRITSWGAIRKDWIINNLQHVCNVLDYPVYKQ